MSTSITSDEIKNELKTTLAARHDLGPGYDDAFIDSFMDKLGAKVVHELQQRQELRPVPTPVRIGSWLTSERRLTIALVSVLLCFLVVLSADLTSNPYSPDRTLLTVLVVLLGLILLVNLALNVRLHYFSK
jgi:hypothetical protein